MKRPGARKGDGIFDHQGARRARLQEAMPTIEAHLASFRTSFQDENSAKSFSRA